MKCFAVVLHQSVLLSPRLMKYFCLTVLLWSAASLNAASAAAPRVLSNAPRSAPAASAFDVREGTSQADEVGKANHVYLREGTPSTPSTRKDPALTRTLVGATAAALVTPPRPPARARAHLIHRRRRRSTECATPRCSRAVQ